MSMLKLLFLYFFVLVNGRDSATEAPKPTVTTETILGILCILVTAALTLTAVILVYCYVEGKICNKNKDKNNQQEK
uniref:Uncharacterized protein n=1 Tax=Panagrolaimus sp. JU765 TaxID=591449 RepID=A0AC34QSK6_9BILA